MTRSLLLILLFCLGAHAQDLSFLNLPLLAQSQAAQLPLTGMLAWFKADSFPTTTTNLTPVGNTTNNTQWIDSAPGHIYTLMQRTAADRPLYNLTNNLQNNLFQAMPCIFFQGNWLSNTTTPITLSTNFTIFVVLKQNATVDNCILGSSTANRQLRANRLNANTWSFFDGASEVVSSAYTSSQTTNRLSTCRRTSGNVEFFDGIINKGPNTASAATTVFDQVCASSGGSGVANYNGTVQEIVIYTNALNDVTIGSLYTNYFKPRWTIAP
jgi:hypothetical protein